MIKTLFLAGLMASGNAGAAVEKRAGRLTIEINKNAELLYTILNLADSSDKLRRGRFGVPGPHLAALRDFAAFKKHPAVAELDAKGRLNWEKGFSYAAFPFFALQFSEVPEGRRLREYPEHLLDSVPNDPPMTREEKVKYLDSFWAKAMDFYRVSGFEADLAGRKEEFERYSREVRASAPRFDVVGLMEDYHGVKKFSKYVLVPSPRSLPVSGSYGPSSGEAVYAFLGISRRIDSSHGYFARLFMGLTGMTDYFGFSSPMEIKHLVLHEFNHSFCNPVVDKYGTEADKYSGLLAGLNIGKSYNDWRVAMYELLVRSVHARLARKAEGEGAAEMLLKINEGNGFVFIRDFYEGLGEYEKNRAKYPTLESFYPRLLARLGDWEIAEMPRPFPLKYFMKPRKVLQKRAAAK
jgi:hypothetical protein